MYTAVAQFFLLTTIAKTSHSNVTVMMPKTYTPSTISASTPFMALFQQLALMVQSVIGTRILSNV